MLLIKRIEAMKFRTSEIGGCADIELSKQSGLCACCKLSIFATCAVKNHHTGKKLFVSRAAYRFKPQIAQIFTD